MSVRDSVRWLGRVDDAKMNAPSFSWSYSGFAVRFKGRQLAARLYNANTYHFLSVLDGKPLRRFATWRGIGTYVLADALPDGEHLLELRRESEGQYGASTLLGFVGATILAPPAAPERAIELIGDSTSCGYGNLGLEHHRPEQNDSCTFSFLTESAYFSYGAIAARSLGADLSIVAVSGWGVYRDREHVRERTVPRVYERIIGDQERPQWDFRTAPQAVVINLGANDYRPPAPSDPGERNYLRSYHELLRRVRARYPDAAIFCVVSPTLSDYWPSDIKARSLVIERTRKIVEHRNQTGDSRVYFLEFPQHDNAQTGCDWHPSRQVHSKMATFLVTALREKLGW